MNVLLVQVTIALKKTTPFNQISHRWPAAPSSIPLYKQEDLRDLLDTLCAFSTMTCVSPTLKTSSLQRIFLALPVGISCSFQSRQCTASVLCVKQDAAMAPAVDKIA
jgi:hypothetical protein